jgi:hypothetical protein
MRSYDFLGGWVFILPIVWYTCRPCTVFPGVNRKYSGTDPLPSSGAEVELHGALPPLPLYIFMSA